MHNIAIDKYINIAPTSINAHDNSYWLSADGNDFL